MFPALAMRDGSEDNGQGLVIFKQALVVFSNSYHELLSHFVMNDEASNSSRDVHFLAA